MADRRLTEMTLVTFDCKSASRSVEGIREICKSADIIALQETWLLPHDVNYIGSIDDNFEYTSKSAVDTSIGILRGRPFGGVALMYRKGVFTSVRVIECKSVRVAAISGSIGDRLLLIFSVYMPTDDTSNLPEFTECISEISAIIECLNADSVFVLGDFNAHPGAPFYTELCDFCMEQKWRCADMEWLGSDSGTYTYVSEAHGCRRWLDHCLVTEAAWLSVTDVAVNYDIYWSDHFPIIIKSKICSHNLNTTHKNADCNDDDNYSNIVWGERDRDQINLYNKISNEKLREINFPNDFVICCDKFCNDISHKIVLDKLYCDIINSLQLASKMSRRTKKCKRGQVVGWNKHVREAHARARMYFQQWLLFGKPAAGPIYEDMCSSRKVFKDRLKWCQDNQTQIKMDILATHHKAKDFGKFWKYTNKLNPKTSVPASVNGLCEPSKIANMFKESFKVVNGVSDRADQVLSTEDCGTHGRVSFSFKEVDHTIKSMTRGKSPGHDGLSIEHLVYAGVHLPRVLKMFFNLCISHGHLPENLMKTIVVPISKNRTGNASDGSNYRPISLATIVAKVLDGLLDNLLAKHIKTQDAQFGFKPGLSTESAVLCLKHTVKYYVEGKTPVIACFLDLSKAFDTVSYEVLWNKMEKGTSTPRGVINLLRYWYAKQTNQVRWAGALSDVYRLECGVRQGGLTSPRLFNLYMDELIDGLSSTGIGCSIGGTMVNNISYADDMVLLCPSTSALVKLLRVCEEYAVIHGLRYNTSKSELLVFKAGNKAFESLPPIFLCGAPVRRVTRFKYLGHWVTDNLQDDADIERERRALAVRCNMLSRRFARCDRNVKITLFKAYCQTFYTCSLWTNYTKKAFNALRIQYNNGFRMLLGLPRFCSASGMFAEARTDGFSAIIRKRTASLMRRVRDSSNSLVRLVLESPACAVWKHWDSVHMRGCVYNII
jgi:exonuclease III